jgi:hypothetical protein
LDLQPTCRALTVLVHARFIAEGARKRCGVNGPRSSPTLGELTVKTLQSRRKHQRVRVNYAPPHNLANMRRFIILERMAEVAR